MNNLHEQLAAARGRWRFTPPPGVTDIIEVQEDEALELLATGDWIVALALQKGGGKEVFSMLKVNQRPCRGREPKRN